MAYQMTADISRMLVAGQKDIFMENFNAYPIEYTGFTVAKGSNKETETYDSMGNLAKGGLKVEGDSINYGKVTQAYQTSVKNKTWANGYSVTLEATKYDLYGTVNSAKAKELARTMRELEEERAIKRYDEALTANLADGVPLASNSHPLVNSDEVNDTLATQGAISNPDVHEAMINMFYDFRNHAGGFIKCKPTDALTHYKNMITVEEIYGSSKKANEMSNTKNALPMMNWHYSTYMSSQTAFMMWDSMYDHVIFQTFMGTEFDSDEDKINTKNMYMNAIAIYETAALPNVGFVYNQGQ